MSPEGSAVNFSVGRALADYLVTVELEPDNPGETAGQTKFRIMQRDAVAPIIDVLRTALGPVEGPDMRFIGSIPVEAALSDPDTIVQGRIVSGHRLVVAELETDRKHILPGIVSEVEPKMAHHRFSKANKYK